MTEPQRDWLPVVEEATPHHWIGTCQGVVLVFAYEGSYDDVRHVHVSAQLIDRLGREGRGPVKMLFVLPPRHSKPPDARVRSAVVHAAKKLERHLVKAAVVVLGTGFGAAIHRSAIAGVLALLPTKVPVKVVSDVREGLALLVDAQPSAFDTLARHCEALASGPPTAR